MNQCASPDVFGTGGVVYWRTELSEARRVCLAPVAPAARDLLIHFAIRSRFKVPTILGVTGGKRGNEKNLNEIFISFVVLCKNILRCSPSAFTRPGLEYIFFSSQPFVSPAYSRLSPRARQYCHQRSTSTRARLN